MSAKTTTLVLALLVGVALAGPGCAATSSPSEGPSTAKKATKKAAKTPAKRAISKPADPAASASPAESVAAPRSTQIGVPVRPEELPPLEQSRVVWGSLLTPGTAVFDVFANWLPLPRATPPASATIVQVAAYLTRKDLAPLAAEDNSQLGVPAEAFDIDVEGENYQALRVVRARVDGQGQVSGSFPLSAGLQNGERFKLQLTATFDALLVLGNLNARGVSSQVYPAQAGMALVIPAGQSVWLPLGDKEYFQFTGEPGGERLTLTVRDPRSLLAEQAAALPAWRRDDASGSSFVQRSEAGRYPLIAEAIRLQLLAP